MATEMVTSLEGTNQTIYYFDDVIGNIVVQRFLLGVYVIVALLGITGNISVLYHLSKFRRRRHSVTRLLIFNLTVCDLMNSLICQPLRMADILQLDGGYLEISLTYCQWTVFLSAIFTITGFFVLTAISLERYLLICFPLTARSIMTPRRMINVTILIWLLSLLFGGLWSFPFVTVNTVFVQGHQMRFCMWAVQARHPLNWMVYYHFITIICYLFPVITMTFAYVSIFRTLHVSTAGPASDVQTTILRTRKSLAKIMLVIAITYTILHSPYFFLLLYMTYGGKIRPNPVFTLILAKLLLLMNSTVNPILYCLYSRACHGKKMLEAINSTEDRLVKSVSTGSQKMTRVVSSSSLRTSKTEMVIKRDGQVKCLPAKDNEIKPTVVVATV